MSFRIIHEPFMLPETVSMLYKYVNGIRLTDLMRQWKLTPDHKKCDPRIRKLTRLQEIMDQVCADVDRDDPFMQLYFGHVECGCENVCLAQLLTDSFCTLSCPDLTENIAEICRNWDQLRQRGYWIQPFSTGSLIFSDGPGCPGGLAQQIRALNYSASFRKSLLTAMEDLQGSVHTLAERIRPLADRLETFYREDSWLFEEQCAYWQEQFENQDPLDLLTRLGIEEERRGAGDVTWVACCMMDTNMLVAIMPGNCGYDLDHNCLRIGSAITPRSLATKRGADLESVSTVLKCISDRKRLEILHRLSKERSYGQALAEATGMDPGNLSRNLAMLHSYGFLKQERGTWRTYYETDQEALHNFLMRVEKVICGKD